MIDVIEQAIQIQQIAAPTFEEALRAAYVEKRFAEIGLLDVQRDAVQNVYGRIAGKGIGNGNGKGNGEILLITAHTDTVFPAGTDLTIKREPTLEKISGAGLGDNSLGVAALLALAESLLKKEQPREIWFVANTGEEGVGDLRGMRAAVDYLQASLSQPIGATIVLEGMGLGRIVHQALGSRRYRIAVSAPGGHSWSAFGAASAVHVIAHIADKLARLEVPASPRTSYNIGRIAGGTSVNTIAESAWLELDLRSEDSSALAAVIAQVEAIVHRYQSASWRNKGVKVALEVIGDRPTGEIPANHPLVRAAERALEDAGIRVEGGDNRSSTDANIPLSRGIPAICVGVTRGGNAHRLDEWISTREVARGMVHLGLLVEYTNEWLGRSP